MYVFQFGQFKIVSPNLLVFTLQRQQEKGRARFQINWFDLITMKWNEMKQNPRKDPNLWLIFFFTKSSGIIKKVKWNGCFSFCDTTSGWCLSQKRLMIGQIIFRIWINWSYPHLSYVSTTQSNFIFKKLGQTTDKWDKWLLILVCSRSSSL